MFSYEMGVHETDPQNVQQLIGNGAGDWKSN